MKKKASESSSKKRKRPEWKSGIWYFLIALTVLSIISSYISGPKGPQLIPFTEFLTHLNTGQVSEVVIRPAERLIIEKTKSGKQFKTHFIEYDSLMQELRDKNVQVHVNPTDSSWVWTLFIQALLPFLLIAGLWFFIFRQAQGVNNQALSFGKTRAVPWKKDESVKKTTFADVAGVDEAVEELQEIVEFLKSPKKFHALGAKIPKGALLMGPPGTGKTLLAKAIAGEAEAAFFSLSGSDFVEMFVGVGASRVRDLFAQAKKNQPSIIFVDELDAVGRQRGAGLGGGHDEREQTLNQLLVEMDGFDEKHNVIILAATNRPDILDPALLRPGRFDRQIVVDKPDISGRMAILTIHAKNKKFASNCELGVIARATPGFTGADLANLLNEAALLAARNNKKTIGKDELEEATERVLAGPERKSRVMNTRDKETIAYHEVGHALVAKLTPGTDPVHKITILPRGMALGYTLQLPIEDKYLISKQEVEDQIKILMGGRVAEEIMFDTVTSGASNDIEKATELARSYVCRYGMSEALGTRKYGNDSHNVFLGRDYSDHTKDYSDTTSSQIDQEIQILIQKNYDSAKALLLKHKKTLITVSHILMEKETLDADAFDQLLSSQLHTLNGVKKPSSSMVANTKAGLKVTAKKSVKKPIKKPTKTSAKKSAGRGAAR